MSQLDFAVIADGVGVITINRPEKRNAFTVAMRTALADLLTSVEVMNQRAVVLEGAGQAFSAGADLTEVNNPTAWHDVSSAGRVFTAFRNCSPVIIAAVHGYALGLGSGLAMASDLVVADEDAQFGYPEIQHGLVAAVTMVGLKDVIPARFALELLVTGRRVEAREAADFGMLNELVTRGQAQIRARELAQSIATHSTLSVHATKRFFYESSGMSHAAALSAGERVIALVRSSGDAEARAKAFVSRKQAAS
ncbi:enoyl-CoA hydratase/isomerase family protein [Conexibacter sp. S30A1]|uniref:enoyl-CoA hydratase/isomerase family protein n=1 Tax=Conexibacter sp. S30A1 TaxID=2937800 RepID=UPI00200DA5F9|nr:enoyl-CoA hydratase/isomerase family protein [Conexibacter sp. S30A1]